MGDGNDQTTLLHPSPKNNHEGFYRRVPVPGTRVRAVSVRRKYRQVRTGTRYRYQVEKRVKENRLTRRRDVTNLLYFQAYTKHVGA
jgi:hypothetical protein